jgi:hypothetical protein
LRIDEDSSAVPAANLSRYVILLFFKPKRAFEYFICLNLLLSKSESDRRMIDEIHARYVI